MDEQYEYDTVRDVRTSEVQMRLAHMGAKGWKLHSIVLQYLASDDYDVYIMIFERKRNG